MNLQLPKAFKNVSIIVAAFNETESLEETVKIIESTVPLTEVAEIILAVSIKGSNECHRICEEIRRTSRIPITMCWQVRPGAGGAYQDAFQIAAGSHVILMAADLETNPYDVHELINACRRNPDFVICTSRWINRGSFSKGYNRVKYCANYIFQWFFRILYNTRLTDLTFGYRLMPTILAKSIRWQECFHPFFLETIVKPLRLGINAVEIPTDWKPRHEGNSQNTFWKNFLYFKIGFSTRFGSKTDFITD
jgi:hypothetical protein